MFRIFLLVLFIESCVGHSQGGYTGVIYQDALTHSMPQLIPGYIQCEFYDVGGEGISYHDSDALNNGSGRLNKGDTYLDTFRIDEAVDVSYTKFHHDIDNSVYNLVQPLEHQLYVGWTAPGEWIKYTVEVMEDGIYELGIMYTANDNGQIAISINDRDVTGPLDIISTFNKADTIEWRQWHHWNYMNNLAEIELKKGVQVLSLRTVTNGQMNYDFLSFNIK